jgi:hypothetical protein
VVVELEKSRAMWVGANANQLEETKFRTDEDYGDAADLFTGEKEVFTRDTRTNKGQVFIRNVDPLPLTVLSLTPRIDISAM